MLALFFFFLGHIRRKSNPIVAIKRKEPKEIKLPGPNCDQEKGDDL